MLASLLLSMHSKTVGSRENSVAGKAFMDISIYNQSQNISD